MILKIVKLFLYKSQQENSNFESFKRNSNLTAKLESKKASNTNVVKVVGSLCS